MLTPKLCKIESTLENFHFPILLPNEILRLKLLLEITKGRATTYY